MDLKRARQEGWHFGAKMVRGAYMVIERERAAKKGYPSPIHDTIEDTHLNYNRCSCPPRLHKDSKTRTCGSTTTDHGTQPACDSSASVLRPPVPRLQAVEAVRQEPIDGPLSACDVAAVCRVSTQPAVMESDLNQLSGKRPAKRLLSQHWRRAAPGIVCATGRVSGLSPVTLHTQRSTHRD